MSQFHGLLPIQLALLSGEHKGQKSVATPVGTCAILINQQFFRYTFNSLESILTWSHRWSLSSPHLPSKPTTLWKKGDTAFVFHPCVSPSNKMIRKTKKRKLAMVVDMLQHQWSMVTEEWHHLHLNCFLVNLIFNTMLFCYGALKKRRFILASF